MALVFVSYVAMAKLGIALPVSDGVVSPVWAPAGIAFAALVMLGLRAWPVVFAAALVGNLVSGAGSLSLGIAVGNTLEAVAAAWLLARVGFEPALARIRDVGWLIVAATTSTTISATNGVTLLWIAGYVDMMGYASRWTLWWFGDAMGMLVVAPALLAIAAAVRSGHRLGMSRRIEFVAVHGAVLAVAVLVFSGETWRYPGLLIPVWIVATLRFGARGSTLSTLIVAATSIAYTIAGTVVIGGASGTQTVQGLQGMLSIVGLSLLLIAAAMSERDAALQGARTALAIEQEAAQRLRQLDEAKDRLLTAVSHELRTPLTSILALATLLEDRRASIDDAKHAEMCARLVSESTRLDALLTDLLDVERARMGLDMPLCEPVDVPAVVRTVLDRHPVGNRTTSLELAPITVSADAGKVERIIDNLVGNALKHTPHDSSVSVAVQPHDDGVLIAVDDRGGGVAPGEREAIFQPFTRGVATSPADVPGTGIGLSLVAHFAELHGGRAWVEDRDGGGASFRVYLPDGEPLRNG